ncbi:MAG TPA: ATP-binding protein [Terriglobia bacterium]|nr:ATP-binding protein [Terriglobia bacterium]
MFVDLSFLYAPKNRFRSLLVASILIFSIAVVDWATKPYVSLGFLYLFPIMLAGGFLRRLEIFGLSLFCAILHEVFSSFPSPDPVRTAMVTIAFTGTGFFLSELVRNRHLMASHLQEVEEQVRFRRDAEDQLEMLIETSPAAIITMDSGGTILRANEAARQLFAPDDVSLAGHSVRSYLADLYAALRDYNSKILRTAMQCKGQRQNGEAFLAATWFSTYKTSTGSKLAAIVVDLSEELRDREELSLNHVLKNARLLVGGVCHEIRNLCSAVSVVQKNLSHVPGLPENQDFQALQTLTEGLTKVVSMELRPSAENSITPVDLHPVLDELRILIQTSFTEAGMTVDWRIPEHLPLVWADRYGLLQVFLNITKNSLRAMRSCVQKQLTVTALPNHEGVLLRFEDTGPGVREPDRLFRPFQSEADMNGLGLYISKAILQTFHGDLLYEPRVQGSCFTASLMAAPCGAHLSE